MQQKNNPSSKNNPSDEEVLKHLETMYNNRVNWMNAGKKLRNKVSESLEHNPTLSLILKACVLANIGIWLCFAVVMYQTFGL